MPTKHLTVSPAYGRDYTSAELAAADWAAGKDFIIETLSNRWVGKPINAEDALGAGILEVHIRYKRMTKVTVIRLS